MEFDVFEATGNRKQNLEKLFQALNSVPPASAEAEKGFFSSWLIHHKPDVIPYSNIECFVPFNFFIYYVWKVVAEFQIFNSYFCMWIAEFSLFSSALFEYN